MKLLKSILAIAVITAMVSSSCTSDFSENIQEKSQTSFNKNNITLSVKKSSAKNAGSLSIFQELNKKLAGKNYEIAQVEIYTAITEAADIHAASILPVPGASSVDYRTGFRFIPNDARRDNRTNLTYVTVSEFATSANGIVSEEVFDAMYNIWENETNCNNVAIDKQAFDLATDGLPSTILSLNGGDPLGPIADHNVIGYVPAFIFEEIGAPPGVLAVNFSFAFLDEDGNRTDINNDGKFDTSHTETWFNDSVNWSTDGAPGTVDINSVALHEFGHSVGHGHSGTLLASFDENGQFTGEFLQFSPTNVMNASYIGIPKTDLSGDDNSIYCENFSAWPYY
ncbi:hypothetical protein [Aquimarina sp. RZ0]|uniref:hypothetical protein n=1 Tax=Aquimarina sp. RZ0 TaxID=2607730 RepID=UPI0011F2140A|nr:hypothetical protein [Aquimarina sp. RZ0]KAA1246969.1 hypothetical protein F0000_05790 [Aquimarina sp. RZ0]